MKHIIGKYLLAIALGMLIMFFLKKNSIKEIEVPIKIEVPVPVIKKEFDTIYEDKLVYKKSNVDSIYYKEYLKLKDSIARDSAYKEAITIREYKPIFEDDTIKIEVYNKVKGHLLKSQVSYKTKPYKIPLDTVIKIKVPKLPEFYGGANILVPFNQANLKTSVNPQLHYINKNHKKLYTLEGDFINKGVRLGISFRF